MDFDRIPLDALDFVGPASGSSQARLQKEVRTPKAVTIARQPLNTDNSVSGEKIQVSQEIKESDAPSDDTEYLAFVLF